MAKWSYQKDAPPSASMCQVVHWTVVVLLLHKQCMILEAQGKNGLDKQPLDQHTGQRPIGPALGQPGKAV
jgi:hypothetical protein